MVVIIDNYDSFTYMIVDYLRSLGVDVVVVRNDEKSVDEIVPMEPTCLVVSPGPCTPDESGVSLPAIAAFAGHIPILGICLGHQAIAQWMGGRIVRAPQVIHGKTSVITHNSQGMFKGLPREFEVMRYHSLVVDPLTLPAELDVTATVKTQADSDESQSIIMGLKHHSLPIEGVQFHPESILTEYGRVLLDNFLIKHGVKASTSDNDIAARSIV